MKFSKQTADGITRILNYTERDTTRLMDKYNKFWFLCCCPGFWVKKVNFPKTFVNVYRPAMILIHLIMMLFCVSCTMSLWTQDNLSLSQKSDRLAYAASVPIITVFYHFVLLYHTGDIRQILFKLVVVLKRDHNDKQAEVDMIKQSRLHNGIFFSSCLFNLILVGLYNFVQTVTTDATFVTCISAWPDIHDRSPLAGLTRVIVYFTWFAHVLRNMGVFLVVHTVLLCLGQQYKNLQNYFEDLNKICKEKLAPEQQELKFEMMFKRGIQQHALTLWCVEETQRVFQITFSSHALLWCGLLSSILPEVMNNKTDSLILFLVSNAPRVAAALVGLGYFMWPAGDITVEASNLPNAMYMSGWQCCHHKSPQIRKLVVLAMMQAQRPIEIKAFGHLTFSYETYVSIVKMSYTLFSVLY